MGPEGSLPHSQLPATCPFPEPDQSSPCLPIPLPKDPSYYCPPIYAWVFQVVSFPHVSPPKPCMHLSSPYNCYILRQFIHLDFITQTILGEQYRSLSSSLCSFLHSHVTSSLLGPNILNTLFSNTLSLCSSLSVCDHVSHPYKTTRKITVLYTLIFLFVDSTLHRMIASISWLQTEKWQYRWLQLGFNPLAPKDLCMSRTAPLTSKRCILYIYSTNVCTEYFKHALYSPFFFLFKMQFVS